MKFVLLTLFITITIVNIVNCHEEALQNNEPLRIQETKQDNLQPTIDSKNILLTRLTRTHHGHGESYSSCSTCQGNVQEHKPQKQQGGECTTCGGGGGGGGSGSFSQSSSQSSSGSFSGRNGKKK
ncbi:uncharacterized protein LOC123290841 [Chrysoperla carnea]|uniref:uncharacterized protein LOC123290841 n=1 Tax=Chrysoperla carnea TaxID=189513 RepID=UPI001D092130|nr:uncharacterized protein LOC123290841 [Chrysoperla carnea]